MIRIINGQTYFTSKYPNIIIPEKPIPHLILKHIRYKPDQVLLVDGLTFKEYSSHFVADTIEKVACGLNKLNIKKGDVLGVILPNLPEYVPIFHGTLLMGGITSLVNPDYTIEELSHTLATVSPRYLAVTLAVYEKIKNDLKRVFPSVEKVILVDIAGQTLKEIDQLTLSSDGIVMSFNQLTNNNGKDYPIVRIDLTKDTAIIPFSSGTTGLFKGVCLSHYNLVSNTYQTQTIETSTYKKNDSVIGVLPFFHSFGLMLHIMLMVKQGYRIVTLPKFEPVRFLELIKKYKVAMSFIVPPIAIMFAKSPIVDKFDLSSLRTLFCGAAPLGSEIEDLIKERFKGRLVIKQGYGATELSPCCFVTPNGLVKSGSSGTLLPNLLAKIISSETGENLGMGEKGEICIKGPNVMLGYYNNEKATNEVIDKDGFLKTGDIGYVDEDGYFFIIDRSKELIKCKGFQVPPAELEALLLSHPKVADACVVGLSKGDMGEVPRGFVVIKQNESLTEKELLDWAHPKIANYKHFRGGIFFIPAIPKSATGKLLRKNLKDFNNLKL
ncbi:4-coumarate-CoA ligase [Dictyostelium discoideum AX4]|uniref:Probable 4-coumarate--CoA ligase 3 n=1 Tax=Dictyostelium discoideum TaxID=44689 RepID=4CL3_DICDI|nr:4-coumarate-CoA ligase [Dictyostelium discoideum AX4]Q54P79.2 RecName: Full=Probable 4-coumarate--CoA ligase 3; Short=4CL 3; AltName: Full=4-coumaroyl-CoA synthase 3 [Dictyostelium discoideum]EAL65024.2 4-coumarate-CoA ligase [Dictyostelium discoideum AX4]|eukprot:XP_638379.2 4-coumarate-CoA ligase [Dictyostelium discoideum AX4]